MVNNFQNLILIDSSIDDLTGFINSINSNTNYIIFNFNTDTYQSIKEKIDNLNLISINSLAIAQHGSISVEFKLVANEPVNILNDLTSWTDFINFILDLNKYNIVNIDFFGCNLLEQSEWFNVFTKLESDTQINFRGSTDITGPIIYGGNFIMESDNVDVKSLYFTENIEQWQGTFFSFSNTGVSNSNKFMRDISGNLIWLHKDINNNNINPAFTSNGLMTKFLSGSSVVTWRNFESVVGNYVSYGGDLSSGVIAISSTAGAFAALKSNGSVVTWGSSLLGADSSGVLSNISSDVNSIYSTYGAFTALKTNGSIIAWGDSLYGGNLSTRTPAGSTITSGISYIFNNSYAFAALTSTGQVITYGDPNYGGSYSYTTNDNGVLPNDLNALNSGVVAVYSAENSFCALKSNGRVYGWPRGRLTGTGYTAINLAYSSDGTSISDFTVKEVYSNSLAYAAITTTGKVFTWGYDIYGGSYATRFPASASLLVNVVRIYNTAYAFAALKSDGSVVTWGSSLNGGSWNTRAPSGVIMTGIVAIYSTERAFAALKSDGSVVTWGLAAAGGNHLDLTFGHKTGSLTSGVISIYANKDAFSALKSDGSVVTWGLDTAGGAISSTITNISKIYSSTNGFVGIKNDGSFTFWGSANSDPSGLNLTYYIDDAIYSTSSNFASIQYTPPPGQPTDLSANSWTTSSHNLTWSATLYTNSYTLRRALNSALTVSPTTITGILTNSYTITDLSAGTQYYYRVTSVGDGGSTNSLTFNTKTLSPIPQNLQTTIISDTSHNLTWSASTGATSYTIQRASDSGFSSVLQTYSGVGGTSTIITGLTPITTYYYRIAAYNSITLGNYSSGISVTTILAIPATPTDFSGNSITDTSHNLTWSSTGADSFIIEKYTDPGFSILDISYHNISSSPYTITGLNPGSTNYYKIAAKNTAGISAFSSGIDVITLSNPPTDLSSTDISTNRVILQWTAPNGATGYVIERSSSNLFTSIDQTYTTTDTSRNITSLSGGTTYYFRIASTNRSGKSTNSDGVEILTIPEAPNDLSANDISINSIKLIWTGTTGSESYLIERSSNNFTSVDETYTSTDTSTNITSLSGGTTYYFRIASINNTGTSYKSSSISALTIPETPSDISSSSVTNISLRLSWTPKTGANSYYIQETSGNSFAIIDNTYNTTDSSINITGLCGNQPYKFRIASINTSGQSNYTIHDVTTSPNGSLILNYSDISNTSVKLNWNSINGVTSYKLNRSTDNFNTIDISYSDLTDISYSITDLSAGTEYKYLVQGFIPDCPSVDSAPITVLTIPNPPDLSANDISINSIKLIWTGTTGSESYIIERSSNNFASIDLSYTSTDTSRNITGLSGGITYSFRIAAKNSSGTSNNSPDINVITIPATPSDISSSSVTNISLRLSWTPKTGANSYYIEETSGNTFAIIDNSYNTTDSSINITGLCGDQQYKFRIASVNTSGQSNYTTHTRTTAANGPVNFSKSDISNTSLKLTWNQINGANNYMIERTTISNFSIIDISYDNLTDTSYSLIDLSAGTLYYFRMNITIPNCPIITADISALTISYPPTNLTVSDITFSSFKLSWDPAIGAQKYILQIFPSDQYISPIINTETLDTSYNATDLNEFTNYYYRIRSNNASGSSNWIYGQTKTKLNTTTQSFIDGSNNIFLKNENIFIGIGPTGAIGTLIGSIDTSGENFPSDYAFDICGGQLYKNTVGFVNLKTNNDKKMDFINLNYDTDISVNAYFNLNWRKNGNEYNNRSDYETGFANYSNENQSTSTELKAKYTIRTSESNSREFNLSRDLSSNTILTEITYKFSLNESIVKIDIKLTNLYTETIDDVIFAYNYLPTEEILSEETATITNTRYVIDGVDISGNASDFYSQVISQYETPLIMTSFNPTSAIYLDFADNPFADPSYNADISNNSQSYNMIIFRFGSIAPNGNACGTFFIGVGDREEINTQVINANTGTECIGDPFVIPLFGENYYIPNDENTHLLFDNNDNLQIYTKTWFAPNSKFRDMSYMRYLIFNYNKKLYCFDLELFYFVELNELFYHTNSLKKINNGTIKLIKNYNKFTNTIKDYRNKTHKISDQNNQLILTFKCNKYLVNLFINSDIKFVDLRNNVYLQINGSITSDEIKKFNGAFINQNKQKTLDKKELKKLFIKEEKIIKNQIFYNRFISKK
jgi:hypothetical protein